MKRGALFLLFITVCTSICANPYNYKILRIIDGDTVEIEAPFLPIELDQKIAIRIIGVDTPEHGARAECQKEREMAEEAKQFVKNSIDAAKEVKVLFIAWDKFGGRIDGDVILDGDPLSRKLLALGYAVPYHGERKTKDWCQ